LFRVFILAEISQSFITPEAGDLRFTQTDHAFYILSLSELAETFFIAAPLPILEGDVITMIGAGNDTELAWVAEAKAFRLRSHLLLQMPESIAG
jgi:hypothetical protein